MTTTQKLIRWLARRAGLLVVRREVVTQWVAVSTHISQNRINGDDEDWGYGRGLCHACVDMTKENPGI